MDQNELTLVGMPEANTKLLLGNMTRSKVADLYSFRL